MQKEFKVTGAVNMQDEQNLKGKYITLVLTHQCNLRCTYCYENNKNNSAMPLEKVLEIVDRELSADDDSEFVEIDMFGGEPLLEFDTIKAIVEYARERKYAKDHIFFITTNGVLLDDERKEWLRNNTDLLQIGLSLDGNKYMHDINRSNSFDKIDLDFFAKTYPEQSVKMTISLATLPYLSEGVIFAHKKGFEVSCNLAYGINWSDENNASILERELMKLIDFYLANPDIVPCAMLDVNRVKSLSYIMDENMRYCGAGRTMRAYDTDGKVYPCQFFLPLSVGDELAERSFGIDFSGYTVQSQFIEKECLDCVIKNVCPTCYGQNYSATGNIYTHDKNMCKLFKIQFKALSYFIAELFKNGRFDKMDKAEVAALLKSSLLINEGL